MIGHRNVIELPQKMFNRLKKHLLPPRCRVEEAAFLFAEVSETPTILVFSFRDWYALTPKDFLVQTSYHIELVEDMRPRMIKAAHDSQCALIEVHSHLSDPARFSSSDIAGFREVVPHVRWRLGNRPYAAIVLTRGGFDALVWREQSANPERLTDLTIRGSLFNRHILPSCLTPIERKFII
jgi:hypothetical protein